MNQPQAQEYPQSYNGYIDLVTDNVFNILIHQGDDFASFLNGVADRADFAYAPGKWTLKELVGHMVDTERVMSFRLMSFARGETVNFPSFDEDSYVANAHFADRSLNSLSDEFSLLRKANLILINSLNEEELDRKGSVNNHEISVRALIFMLAGHVMHHINIIRERYLTAQ